MNNVLSNQFSNEAETIRQQLAITSNVLYSHLDPDIFYCLEQQNHPFLLYLSSHRNQTVDFITENAPQINRILRSARELFQSGFPLAAGTYVGKVTIELVHYVS